VYRICFPRHISSFPGEARFATGWCCAAYGAPSDLADCPFAEMTRKRFSPATSRMTVKKHAPSNAQREDYITTALQNQEFFFTFFVCSERQNRLPFSQAPSF